jgi:hypothetical protein
MANMSSSLDRTATRPRPSSRPRAATVYGGEAAGGYGSFCAQGEYYINKVNQSGFSATTPTLQLTLTAAM